MVSQTITAWLTHPPKEALWAIGFVVILTGTVLLLIFLKRKGFVSRRIFRSRIPGQICPVCHSTDIYWAGYADRKECGHCGKIL